MKNESNQTRRLHMGILHAVLAMFLWLFAANGFASGDNPPVKTDDTSQFSQRVHNQCNQDDVQVTGWRRIRTEQKTYSNGDTRFRFQGDSWGNGPGTIPFCPPQVFTYNYKDSTKSDFKSKASGNDIKFREKERLIAVCEKCQTALPNDMFVTTTYHIYPNGKTSGDTVPDVDCHGPSRKEQEKDKWDDWGRD